MLAPVLPRQTSRNANQLVGTRRWCPKYEPAIVAHDLPHEFNSGRHQPPEVVLHAKAVVLGRPLPILSANDVAPPDFVF